jgi:gliding motility-associated-like protein
MKEKRIMNELFTSRILAVVAFCTLVLGLQAQNHVRNGGFDELRPGADCYQPKFTPLHYYLEAWYTQCNTPERISPCGQVGYDFATLGPTILPKTFPNFIHYVCEVSIGPNVIVNPPRIDTLYHTESLAQRIIPLKENHSYLFSFWGNANTWTQGWQCKPRYIDFFFCRDSVPVDSISFDFYFVKANEGNQCLHVVFEVTNDSGWEFYERTLRPPFPVNYLILGFGENSNPLLNQGVYCDALVPNQSAYGSSIGLDDLKLVPISINPVFPNTFTPNGDGSNEAFVIKHLPEGSSLEVYNRWGIKVFAQDNYTQDWRGQSDQGQDLPEGVYYLVVRYLDGVGETQVVRKTVHLFR